MGVLDTLFVEVTVNTTLFSFISLENCILDDISLDGA